jgi:integrase
MATKVRGEHLTVDRVSRIISKIGRAANVIVDQAKDKPATAHDLRRSFGQRWAALVMPQVLMELMQHESIDTTLKYYVGRNAQRTAKVLREAYEQANRTKKESDEQRLRDTFRDTDQVAPEAE